MESDLNHRSDLLIPCRHERRLTLFDIFEWTYIVLGVFTGILFGWKQSGISGGIIGAVFRRNSPRPLATFRGIAIAWHTSQEH